MSSEALWEQVREVVATAFQVPIEEVTPETSSASLQNWDSMGHLMLILELEQQFAVQLDPEQMDSITSVADIVHLLQSVPTAALH